MLLKTVLRPFGTTSFIITHDPVGWNAWGPYLFMYVLCTTSHQTRINVDGVL